MQIRLHAHATTPPKQRALIQASTQPVAEWAEAVGVSETTLRRWRSRTEVHDRAHPPHRLAPILSPAQE
jgi:transposase-like protein